MLNKLIVKLVLFTIVASAAYASSESIRTVNVETRYRVYNSVEEMDNRAALVVLGTPVKSFEDSRHVVTWSEGSSSSFYTLRSIRVDKVLSHKPKVKVKKGDTITAAEQATITQQGGQLVKLTKDDYVPMQQGDQYILFLTEGSPDVFVMINRNLGRLAFEGKKVRSMSFNIRESKKATDFLEQAKVKYNLK